LFFPVTSKEPEASRFAAEIPPLGSFGKGILPAAAPRLRGAAEMGDRGQPVR
jgi:hypothetical protein